MCKQDTVVCDDNSSPVRRPPSKMKRTRFWEFEDDKVRISQIGQADSDTYLREKLQRKLRTISSSI